MRSIASLARTLSGCVVGTLLAYLRENSGAARATHGIAMVAPAAAPAKSTLRRVLKIVIMLPPVFLKHHGQAPPTRQGSGEKREGAMAKAKSVKATVKRRAAIVTGGASGIGLACVEALLKAGWQVGVLDRDEKALERARRRFRGERRVRIAELDVTDEPAAVAAVND